MKNLLLFGVLLFSGSCVAQTFYVEKTEKKFESKIIDKLKYDGFKLTDEKLSADFVIDCLVDGQYNAWKMGNMFHGYVKISNAKTGEEIIRTKEVGKSPNIYNGMQAGPKIMSVIADKYLIQAVNKAIDSMKVSTGL